MASSESATLGGSVGATHASPGPHHPDMRGLASGQRWGVRGTCARHTFVKQSLPLIETTLGVRERNWYRPNIAVILADHQDRVLLARRSGSDNWQFPQGGVASGESPEDALYRELMEEVGLAKHSVKILGSTARWLSYRVPERYRRPAKHNSFVGQKQKWYLLRFLGDSSEIRLDREESPEFDCWRWVSYWYPVRCIVDFKRRVYAAALLELAPCLSSH